MKNRDHGWWWKKSAGELANMVEAADDRIDQLGCQIEVMQNNLTKQHKEILKLKAKLKEE